MAQLELNEGLQRDLKEFLEQQSSAELLPTYLYYLEKTHDIHPVIYPKTKKIYRSPDDVIALFEGKNQLWRETEVIITFEKEAVNEQTKKIYICPFTGKVFGDNTHPNPQDAIYDWVSRCPENTERVGGLKVKRFFVSEDPEMIKKYIQPRKESIVKKVYSSALNGKLFSTKEGVVEDFKKSFLKPLPLDAVQEQSRYELDDRLVAFFHEYLDEEKITAFVEQLAEHGEFAPYISKWVEE